MKIAGLQKTTLVDYPGKVACTLFTQGCNYRCGYCHNPALLSTEGADPVIPETEFLEWLATKKKWLDGVCVTGGEPTLQADLPEFLAKIKELGFLVKLDSNGSNPRMLEKMFDAKSIDFLAMDIKAPLEKYRTVVNAGVDLNAINESVQIIRERAPDYEFRTTVAPDWYSMEDALAIGTWLEGAKAYFIQNFVPEHAVNAMFREKRFFTRKELEELKAALEPFFGTVGIRE
ncbi:MAG: anaerobic ribonucleoside-triphosphate reductase activating protein [Candidatus Micrarchaeia archaeon]